MNVICRSFSRFVLPNDTRYREGTAPARATPNDVVSGSLKQTGQVLLKSDPFQIHHLALVVNSPVDMM